MKHFFYPKLAADSVRKNRRITIPYILIGLLMVMLFSILLQIGLDSGLDSLTGGDTVRVTMNFGVIVTGLVALIFLFYSNTFLMKNRKKELGIYNILGMSKFNISRILIWESLYYYGIALIGGLVFGQIFSRLAYLALKKLIGAEIPLQPVYSLTVVLSAGIFFAFVYILLFFRMLFQVRLSNPIELLRSEKTGEKPPKANWLIAVIGLILLGIGYYMAQTIKDPVEALSKFFLAVVFVILGTFLLFMAVSVVVCRLLQKNKRYYYKTNHFISVGTMVYRMKRNGAGLAFICILSTMVLVTLSTTSCLYFGRDLQMGELYGREMQLTRLVRAQEPSRLGGEEELVTELLEKYEFVPSNFLSFHYVKSKVYAVNGNWLTLSMGNAEKKDSDWNQEEKKGELIWLTADAYEQMTGTSVSLAPGEALWDLKKIGFQNMEALDLSEGSLTLDGYGELQLKKVPKEIPYNLQYGENSLYLIVPDEETMLQMRLAMGETENASLYAAVWCDISPTAADAANTNELIAELGDSLQSSGTGWSVDFRSLEDHSFVEVYGGIFFLGILLSIVFLIAMCMIMYYKQISEGYEDQSRFEIQRKVGMTEQEIRKSINSQVLTVFFLPLGVACIHVLMAFHMIQKIMSLFNLVYINYLALITLVTVLIFALVYCIVYEITSKAYYNIVKK